MRVPAMRAAALTVVAFLALAFAPTALAEATFSGSTPANGETSADVVTEIEIRFSEPVVLSDTETRLLDAEGTDLIYESVELDDGAAWLLEPALSLDNGVYGVVWQAQSADDQTLRGVIRFGVGDVVLEQPPTETAQGDGSNPSAPQEVAGAAGGGPVVSIGSAIATLGVILGWGVALFVAFISLARMPWVGQYLLRLMRLTGIIAVVGAVIELAGLLLGSEGVTAIIGTVLILVAGAAIAGIPGMVNGTPFIWVLSGVVIVGYVLSGQSLEAGPIWLSVISAAAHVTFAAIWGGGLVALAISLALVLRRRTKEESWLPDGSELAVRYSRMAIYSVIAVSITGILLAFFIMPSFGALFSTGWGWILVIKTVLVVALAVLTVRSHFRSIPEIEYAQVQREGGSDVRELEREHLNDLRAALLPQMAVVVVILVLSGLLVQASPIAG